MTASECATLSKENIITKIIENFSSTKSFTNNNLNPLSANPEKWSNTLKQIVGNLPAICLSVFDHFMNLALKGLIFHFSLSNTEGVTSLLSTFAIFF